MVNNSKNAHTLFAYAPQLSHNTGSDSKAKWHTNIQQSSAEHKGDIRQTFKRIIIYLIWCVRCVCVWVSMCCRVEAEQMLICANVFLFSLREKCDNQTST